MAQGDYRLFDSDGYFTSFAGIVASGFADGEWFSIERDTPAFSDVAGTDGEVTRSKTNDDRATIKLKLMQSSPVNDLLSALYNLDKNTPKGAGIGPFLHRDTNGSTLFSAEACWISEEPPMKQDRTATEREWTFRVAKLISHHGS